MTLTGEKVSNWQEILLGALIVQAVGGIWLYLRSIGNKVDKKEHDRAVEALTKRIEKHEAEARDFATREMLRELRIEFHGSLGEVKAEIKAQGSQIIALLTKDRP